LGIGDRKQGEADETFASPQQRVMTYNPDIHHRRSIRLHEYDYSFAGAYFVTLCAFQRECLFGEIVDGAIRLNGMGTMVRDEWLKTAEHFPAISLDVSIVMPNHFHGIVTIVGAKQDSSASPGFESDVRNQGENIKNQGEAGETLASPLPCGTQSGSFSAIIQNFKSVSTRKINQHRNNPGCPVWQRNYYERVIRNEQELAKAREYIVNNPMKWALDRENPANMK